MNEFAAPADQPGRSSDDSPAGGPQDSARPPRRGPWSAGPRTIILFSVLAALLIGAGTAGAAGILRSAGGPERPPSVSPASVPSATGVPSPTPSVAPPEPEPAAPISMSATGDIVMGNAPGGLPPNNGKGFFDPVKDALAADLQMGNLEQTLTEDTGYGKCSAASRGKTCYSFRSPQSHAQVLRDAGFDLMNLANNHANDFGPKGYQNTQAALDASGIKYTGWPGQITVVEVNGVKVAVVGFASYNWSNDVTDLNAAASIVKKASEQADLVVVQAHLGAEGADRTHTRPGPEIFLNENRGDPIRFAHTVVDAGADLVVGHGPHVMRGMEFYQGRLIAYSLGNFAGYRALGIDGITGVGGVLKVTLRPDGTYVGGTLVPTHMVAPGLPRPDPRKQAVSLVSSLSAADFPTSGAKIGPDGAITP